MNIRSAPLLPYVMCAVTHSNQTAQSYHRGHPLKISGGCQAFPMIWKDLIPYVPPGSSVAAIRQCMWIGQVTPVHINHVLCNWRSSWADLSGLTCRPMWVPYVCKPDLRTHAQGSTASYVQTSIQGTFWQTPPMSHTFTDDVIWSAWIIEVSCDVDPEESSTKPNEADADHTHVLPDSEYGAQNKLCSW